MNHEEFHRKWGHIKCSRCNRTIRNENDLAAWNVVFDRGTLTGYLCPDCQTEDENLEARFKEITIDYSTMHQDSNGKWRVNEII